DHLTYVDMFYADFWVQVYDLPVGFFSSAVRIALGNFIGSFVEFEDSNLVPYDREFMRLAQPKKTRALEGEQWLWRRTPPPRTIVSAGRNPRQTEASSWRSGDGHEPPKRTIPRNMGTLLGNLGASIHTEGLPVSYGPIAVESEQQALHVARTQPATHYDRVGLELLRIDQPRAVQVLSELIKAHRPDIVFLSETLVGRQQLEEIRV
ncbi:hypothetical protein LINPERHAP1_LOCUS4358, partial [Linum perenne]